MADKKEKKTNIEATISDVSIKELMESQCRFIVPDYQRGFRWDARNVVELLDDIYEFFELPQVKENSSVIYCVQPLVVCPSKIRAKKGSAKPLNVVDGQQRLTTIYLILNYLRQYHSDILNGVCELDGAEKSVPSPMYTLSYETRKGSKDFEGSEDFIKNIAHKSAKDAEQYIDYYHMHIVYAEIQRWFRSKKWGEKISDENKAGLRSFTKNLIERVCFIWYSVDRDREIEVFRRLNIGKIPLTDAELIKAKFLDRTNCLGEKARDRIARDWYEIENTLQNDEFWMFIHGHDYSKATRIDFIFDIILENDYFKLKKAGRGRPKAKGKGKNDRHICFQYFNQALERAADDTEKWENAWEEVRAVYQIFMEWYNDYKLFHYIGYLVAVRENGEATAAFISQCVRLWRGEKAAFDYIKGVTIENKDKGCFIEKLKSEIAESLKHDKRTWKKDDTKHNFLEDLINNADLRNTIRSGSKEAIDKWKLSDYLKEMRFEVNKYGNYHKRCCVNILLLHNIETIIQYNDMLVMNEKYSLPYFSRFPFHLYALENWDVEHIHSNSGGNDSEKERIIYLLLACKYLDIKEGSDLHKAIRQYMKDSTDYTKRCTEKRAGKDISAEAIIEGEKKALDDSFGDIRTRIDEIGGGALPASDKNKIYNFTLLDRSTNREYKDHVFPYKRAYISEKERGIKFIFDIEGTDVLPGSAGLPFKAVEVEERRQKLIRKMIAYEKTDNADLKKELEAYINNADRYTYAQKGKARPEPYTDDYIRADANVSGYSVYYLKKEERTDGLRYKLLEQPETAPFVPVVTKNIFTKYYSTNITTMLQWTLYDANEYWNDMKSKLEYFFDELNAELEAAEKK